MSTIYVCTVPDCSVTVARDVYLLPSDAASQIDLLLLGGFSPEGFTYGLLGMFSLFSIGVATGLIVSQIRKLNRL